MRRRLTTALSLALLAAALVSADPLAIAPAAADSHEEATTPTITPTVSCDDDSMTIAVQIDGTQPGQDVRLHDWTLSGGGYEAITSPSQLEERTVPVLRTLRVWVTVDGETRYDSGDLYRGSNPGACGLTALPVGTAIDVADTSVCVDGAARYSVTVSAGQQLTYAWMADGTSTIETLLLSGEETLTWDVPLGSSFRFRLYDQHGRPTFDSGQLIAVVDDDCRGSAEPSLDASLDFACTDGALHAAITVRNDGNVPVDARIAVSTDSDEEDDVYAVLAPGDVVDLPPFAVPGGALVEISAQHMDGDGSSTLDQVEGVAPTPCAVEQDPGSGPDDPGPGDPSGPSAPGSPESPDPGPTTPFVPSGPLAAPVADGPALEVAATAARRDTLPRTGGGADRAVAHAAGLAALGAALLAASRRQRTA